MFACDWPLSLHIPFWRPALTHQVPSSQVCTNCYTRSAEWQDQWYIIEKRQLLKDKYKQRSWPVVPVIRISDFLIRPHTMTGSFKRGEGFDIIMHTRLRSIIRFNFQFDSNCDTDFFIYMWAQMDVWWHFEGFLCCYVFCFCLFLIIECVCMKFLLLLSVHGLR
jgi:hypothetical protein